MLPRCNTRPPTQVGDDSRKNQVNPWDSRDASKDWRCPDCHNLNYAGRTACNRCQAPQLAHLKGGGGLHRTTINPDVAPTIKIDRPRVPEEAAPGWTGPGLGPLVKPEVPAAPRNTNQDWRGAASLCRASARSRGAWHLGARRGAPTRADRGA